MRHGIRTPASTYPNDPYVNDTFYPIGWGQLTNVSISQCLVIKFVETDVNKILGREGGAVQHRHVPQGAVRRFPRIPLHARRLLHAVYGRGSDESQHATGQRRPVAPGKFPEVGPDRVATDSRSL